MPARTWSQHTIITYKLQYLWCVWTLPYRDANLLSPNEPWIIECRSLVKNHIEFQQGNKLLGTSLAALHNSSQLSFIKNKLHPKQITMKHQRHDDNEVKLELFFVGYIQCWISWAVYKLWYCPLRFINSSWVPISVTRPCLMTAILLASWIVERRCAMVIQVRPLLASSNAACTTCEK